MPKFRKKPVVIEAAQFTDIYNLPPEVFHRIDEYLISTLEGEMKVSLGDWVITGIKGEHYPCKPDIFEATYEKVEHEAELEIA